MSSSSELFGNLELPHFFTVVHQLNELLFSIFPRDQLIPADNNHLLFAKQVILLPLNLTVKAMNLRLLGTFRGDMRILYAIDTADENNQEDGVHHIPAEVLRAQETGGVPQGKLKLKLGCPLILLWNLNV
jgi:hypothetical protein